VRQSRLFLTENLVDQTARLPIVTGKSPTMKRILSFLLCIILLKAQAFALRGGPPGADSGTILVGTYSGTLIPTDANQGTDVLDFNTGEKIGSINSIGLFSVAMPTSGPGTGSFLIFTEGISFAGTITAVGDSGAGTITGLLEATYDFIDFVRDDQGNPVPSTTTDANGNVTTTFPTQSYQAAIRGSLNATVQSTAVSIATASPLSSNFGRIAGTAQTGRMFVGPQGAGQLVTDKIVTYTVDGVKQSLTADAGATLTAPGNNVGGGFFPIVLF
jgi:hypothetical protein